MIAMHMPKWIDENLLFLYAALAYVAVFFAASAWSLPSKVVSQISNTTTAAPAPLPVSSIYGTLAFTIIGGFIIGFFALRYLKSKKHSYSKDIFMGATQVGFLLILMMDNVYATLIIAKLALNLYPAITNAMLLALVIGSYIVIGIPLMFMPFLSFIKGERMPKLWFNSIGITIAILSAIAMGSSISMTAALIFIGVFSVYDFVAVFITKHMQALVSFIIPNQQQVKDEYGKDKKVSKFISPIFLYTGDMEYLDKLHCINCGASAYKKDAEGNERCRYCGRYVKIDPTSKTGFIVLYEGKDRNKLMGDSEPYRRMLKREPKMHLLDLGDLLIPGMVIASATIWVSPLMGIAMVAGALIGMALNSLVAKKYKRAIPALPLLCITQICFYILVSLL